MLETQSPAGSLISHAATEQSVEAPAEPVPWHHARLKLSLHCQTASVWRCAVHMGRRCRCRACKDAALGPVCNALICICCAYLQLVGLYPLEALEGFAQDVERVCHGSDRGLLVSRADLPGTNA